VELFSRGEQQRERVDHRAVLRATGHQAGHRERGPRPTQDIHRRRNTRQAGGAPLQYVLPLHRNILKCIVADILKLYYKVINGGLEEKTGKYNCLSEDSGVLI
jgi:hypothetical protein